MGLDSRNAPLGAVYLVREIQKAKWAIEEMERALRDYPALIEEKRNELSVLETVLARHPSKPDVTKIQAARKNRQRTIPYGNMVKSILDVLRGKEVPIPSFAVTMGVVQQAGLEFSRKEYIQFQKQVLRSLNYLKKRGEVVREPGPAKIGRRTEVYWRMP